MEYRDQLDRLKNALRQNHPELLEEVRHMNLGVGLRLLNEELKIGLDIKGTDQIADVAHSIAVTIEERKFNDQKNS